MADVVGACFVVEEGPLCVALVLGAEVRGGFVGVVAGGEPPGDRFEGPIAAKLRPLFNSAFEKGFSRKVTWYFFFSSSRTDWKRSKLPLM